MNKFISKLSKINLNVNQLKIIAIVTMIIDHVGYYFEPCINDVIYYVLRVTGRISMPIFAFILVQGFFHTSSLKKYILRIFSFAIVTQIATFIIGIFDKNGGNLSINKELNVLFSYTLSLIVLWLIHERYIIKKFNYNQNMVVKIVIIFLIIGIFLFIPFDYEIYIPLLIVMFYFIEKLRITIYISRQSYSTTFKSMITAFVSEDKIKNINILLISIALIIVIIQSANTLYWYMLLSIPFMYLYSGEKGKSSNKLKYLFYAIFPLQHILIYLAYLIYTK